MRPFGDDPDEMFANRLPRDLRIDDDAVEAILRGDDAPQDFDDVAAFAAGVRASARSSAPAPSPELAAMLQDGIAKSAELVVAVPTARRKAMVVPQFVAGLTLAGKIMLGTSLVGAAAITGAAAGGNLPDPGPDAVALFGEEVSDDARGGDGTPGVVGLEISAMARARAEQRRVERETVREAADEVDAVDVEVDETESEPAGKPDGAGKPEAPGRPESPGQQGLDTANSTPAAGVVPVGSPAVTAPGVSAPPASRPPASVPAGATPPISVGPPVSTPPASTPPVEARPVPAPGDTAPGRSQPWPQQ